MLTFKIFKKSLTHKTYNLYHGSQKTALRKYSKKLVAVKTLRMCRFGICYFQIQKLLWLQFITNMISVKFGMSFERGMSMSCYIFKSL